VNQLLADNYAGVEKYKIDWVRGLYSLTERKCHWVRSYFVVECECWTIWCHCHSPVWNAGLYNCYYYYS